MTREHPSSNVTSDVDQTEHRMGGRLFVEGYPLDVFGLEVPIFHLYRVHRDTNGVERVLRAGSDDGFPIFGSTMAVESNVRLERSLDARGNESAEDRMSREVLLPTLTTDEAWSLMVRYASQIEAIDYPYYPLDQNSNTFIGALLAAVGAEPGDVLPVGVSETEAVGIANYDELLSEVAPPENAVIRGTAEGEELFGVQVADRIVGRAGDDTLIGRRGDDHLQGGTGNDEINGGSGGDQLLGGTGDDVIYDGYGRDVMRGGVGPDVFVLSPDRQRDVISDFESGVDMIDLSRIDVSSADNIAIIEVGSGYGVVYDGDTLAIVRSETALDPSDLSFA